MIVRKAVVNSKLKAGKKCFVIGMDLGGTKILATAVDRKGRIKSETKLKTLPEEGPNAVVQRMAQAARDTVDKAGLKWKNLRGIGVGAPGPLDPVRGIVHNTPNLPGWQGVPLAARLSEALGMPVFVENDVNLGTLGEYALGAGQGSQDVIGVFVGTGVGGGLILDGKLRSGFRHAAAEVGHMIILADGPVCGCGKRGCLESVASRTAMVRDIELGIASGRETLIPALTDGGKKRLTSGLLAKGYREGDPLVTEVLGKAQWYLGLLTASLVNLLDPEIIVFGGGVVEALGEVFMDPIRVTARQYYIQQNDAEKVRIISARLGDHAGVLGAAVLAWHRLTGGFAGTTG
jgi:glucokinase